MGFVNSTADLQKGRERKRPSLLLAEIYSMELGTKYVFLHADFCNNALTARLLEDNQYHRVFLNLKKGYSKFTTC